MTVSCMPRCSLSPTGRSSNTGRKPCALKRAKASSSDVSPRKAPSGPRADEGGGEGRTAERPPQRGADRSLPKPHPPPEAAERCRRREVCERPQHAQGGSRRRTGRADPHGRHSGLRGRPRAANREPRTVNREPRTAGPAPTPRRRRRDPSPPASAKLAGPAALSLRRGLHSEERTRTGGALFTPPKPSSLHSEAGGSPKSRRGTCASRTAHDPEAPWRRSARARGGPEVTRCVPA